MDFNTFQSTFLSQVKSKNRKCFETIEENKVLIQENLGDNADLQAVTNFVNAINDIIIENDNNLINIIIDSDKNLMSFKNKYDLIEKILKHSYFTKVFSVFINSDVLVRACKEGNKNAAKWLLTMEVTPYLQDENGVSALMYAAQQCFDFVIRPYLNDNICINLVDKNGENVLFYCLRNSKYTIDKYHKELILFSDIFINQTNLSGETALVYCIKNDIIEPVSLLLQNTALDVNIADNDGKTAAMYLTEKGNCDILLDLHEKKCNYEYIDMNGESAISILMSKLYSSHNTQSYIPYDNYVRILCGFIKYQIDFNYPMDQDENTAFMTMLVVNDMTTATYCAKHLEKLDLSVKNKYGESATSLCYKLNHYRLLPLFKNNPTFDYHYRDPINQNTLLMISAINNPSAMKDLLENDPSIINEVNCNNENALIIATKINQIQSVEILLKRGINVNHQDQQGNTALHYAIEIQEAYLIHKLMTKKPDIHLLNNEGKSPLDFANKIEDSNNKEIILNIINNTSHKMNKIKLDKKINNKYVNRIQKYLIPYANNYYPDFISTNELESIKEDEFHLKRNKNYMKELVIVLILGIFTIFNLHIISVAFFISILLLLFYKIYFK